MNRRHRRRAGGATPYRRIGATLGVILLGLTVASCDAFDRMLSVDLPGAVDAEDMANPVNAHFLVSGAISDFDCAFGAYIVNQGLLGNELRDASFTAARFSLDRRDFTLTDPYGVNSCAGNPPGVYTPLATARWTSDNALTRLEGWTDDEVAGRIGLIAQAAAYSGYTHVLMGEGFCSVVIEELGPEVQPAAAFEKAVTRFTRAIEAATQAGSTDIRNMALLGRARAHLNLGNLAPAAADARALLDAAPQYVRISTASVAHSRRWNRVGDEFVGGRITVDPSYRDLTVEGEPDTRVSSVDTGNGHDGVTRVWLATKFGTSRTGAGVTALRSTPLPIATWREAHLIIAEAEGGQEAVDRINVLRANAGLPAYAGGTNAEIQQQVIVERARELFLEGHHLNDLRRHSLPFTPAPGETYRQGGSYGTVSCFPLPQVERENNPNIS